MIGSSVKEQKEARGWVDCNTCCKDKKTVERSSACGRSYGEKRSKYQNVDQPQQLAGREVTTVKNQRQV